MKPDDPRHGTRAGMQQHRKDGETGCEPCREARRTYERKRKVKIILGEPRTIPAARTRRHIASLVDAGMQIQRIIEESRSESVDQIYRGEITTIHTSTARRIMAVKAVPGENYWPAVGASRRIRALAARGHQMSTIAARIGRAPQWVSDLASLSRGWKRIDPSTWIAIREVYEEMWNEAGNPQLAQRARRKGWVPPLAWDDESIDDPDATPDVGETKRASGGAGRPIADLVEDIEWLLRHDSSLTAGQLAERLGYADRSAVQNALARHGYRDLLDRLNLNQERRVA